MIAEQHDRCGMTVFEVAAGADALRECVSYVTRTMFDMTGTCAMCMVAIAGVGAKK